MTQDEKIEHKFLNDASAAATDLTIFLVNGVKLQGSITNFSDDIIILTRAGASQIVYRHAISTIALA